MRIADNDASSQKIDIKGRYIIADDGANKVFATLFRNLLFEVVGSPPSSSSKGMINVFKYMAYRRAQPSLLCIDILESRST